MIMKENNNIVTFVKLHELFYYNNRDGNLIWKKSNRGTKKGKIAGCIDNNGYRVIRINNKNYYAHRLIWLYTHGYFPENIIDHIDQIPSNNKLNNLREVSKSCNRKNCKISKNNTSGITGVTYHNTSKKYQATIMVNGIAINLGYFKLIKDAAIARYTGESKYNFLDCQSTSSAYNYLLKTKVLQNV